MIREEFIWLTHFLPNKVGLSPFSFSSDSVGELTRSGLTQKRLWTSIQGEAFDFLGVRAVR